MPGRVAVVEFRVEDPAAVIEHVDALGEAHEGWVNLKPVLSEEDAPAPKSALSMLFSAGIHEAPVCTWVAGRRQRHGIAPDSLGVQHATGTRTVAHLRSLGIELPHGWRAVQDHPRRGVVVLAPAGTDHAEEIAWLLEAGTALSRVRMTGDWVAEIHLRT